MNPVGHRSGAVSHVSSTTPDPERAGVPFFSSTTKSSMARDPVASRRVAQAFSASTGDPSNRACVGLIVQGLVSELTRTDLLLVVFVVIQPTQRPLDMSSRDWSGELRSAFLVLCQIYEEKSFEC